VVVGHALIRLVEAHALDNAIRALGGGHLGWFEQKVTEKQKQDLGGAFHNPFADLDSLTQTVYLKPAASADP
jgi:hypothetical protein